MKRFIIAIFCLAIMATTCVAQNDGETFEEYKKRKQNEMAGYKQQRQQDFDDFRKKVNEEYAAFLKQRWEDFQAFRGVEPPAEPKPPTPVPVDPDRKPTTDPVPYQKLTPIPVKPVFPKPILPEVPPVTPPITPTVSFDFYNIPCRVKMLTSMRVKLHEISESEASRVWTQLSDEQYDVTIRDLLKLKTDMMLNDWGYIQLVRKFTEVVYNTTFDAAAITQAYILSQSGIDMRIMRTANHFYIAIPFREEIYHRRYIKVGDIPYYLIDQTDENRFYVMNKNFEGSTVPSLSISNTPQLEESPTESRVFVSRRYPEIRISINENRNLLDFYNDYPLTSKWNYYSRASLSTETKERLYPTLRNKIKGMSEADAANVLIDFVQTAFEYATDNEQFGYERPLFGDESFFYPYSDCEDRSILYSILVRDLLGLDVVLLHFPGHLATAVRFTTSVSGDYLLIDGVRYVVCDPTYIGATIGMAMEQFKKEGTEIEVVEIY